LQGLNGEVVDIKLLILKLFNYAAPNVWFINFVMRQWSWMVDW